MKITIEIDTTSQDLDELKVLDIIAKRAPRFNEIRPGGHVPGIDGPINPGFGDDREPDPKPAEKPKRKPAARKPKAEKTETPAEEAAPAPETDAEPETGEDSAPDLSKREAAVDAASQLLSKGKGDEVRAALSTVGARKVSAMTEEQAVEFLAELGE